ncbi:hypothetical protein JCM5350_003263 [Sporobolomyces pararoseus]
MERRFTSLAQAFFEPEDRSSPHRSLWKPPEDLQPVNRKQLVAPDLETSFGDIIVSVDQFFPTFSLATVEDDNIRLTSSYAASTPDTYLLHLLAPSGFDRQRKFSYETRWENLNCRLNSIQVDTLRSYERLITRYLEFCEEEGVEPKDRFPADPRVVNNWVGKSGRKYSPGYLRSWFNAIEFWHQLHEVSFDLDKKIKDRTINGAKRIGPPARPLRRGLTIEDLLIITNHLEQETKEKPVKKSVNVAINAASLFLFFGMGRAKDAIVERRTQMTRTSRKDRGIAAQRELQGLPTSPKTRNYPTFSKSYDVHGGCFQLHQATENMPAVYSVRIPWDKMKHEEGETIQLAEQVGIDSRICPVRALTEHLELNHPSEDDPAFSYFGDNGQRIWLTRSWFTDRINEALLAANKEKIHGHSFREGGATFYTTAGVDPEVTRACGRWAGKSNFQLYLRQKQAIAARHLANLHLGPEKKKTSTSKAPKNSRAKNTLEVVTDDEIEDSVESD